MPFMSAPLSPQLAGGVQFQYIFPSTVSMMVRSMYVQIPISTPGGVVLLSGSHLNAGFDGNGITGNVRLEYGGSVNFPISNGNIGYSATGLQLLIPPGKFTLVVLPGKLNPLPSDVSPYFAVLGYEKWD